MERKAERTSKPVNIMLAGVGGQGVLLASEVLALAAAVERKEVKQTEVHGVAQRGGAVVSHVRYGDVVFSPVVKRGEADFLVAFEKLEGLRHAHCLRPGGLLVGNDHEVRPRAYYGEPVPYPGAAYEFLRSKGVRVVVVPAYRKAVELGQARVTSLVLLGALSAFLDLKESTWERVLEERIPARFLDINRRAFSEGRRLAAEGSKLVSTA